MFTVGVVSQLSSQHMPTDCGLRHSVSLAAWLPRLQGTATKVTHFSSDELTALASWCVCVGPLYVHRIDFSGLFFLERDSDFEFDEGPQPIAKRRKVAPSHLRKRPRERKSAYVLYPDAKGWLDVPCFSHRIPT